MKSFLNRFSSLLLFGGAMMSLSLYSCSEKVEDPSGQEGNGSNPPVSETVSLTTFEPLEAGKDVVITLKGENFGTSIDAVTVWFGDVEAEVSNVKTDEISVYVPELAEAGPYKISVQIGDGEKMEYETAFTFQKEEEEVQKVLQVATYAGSGKEAATGVARTDGPALEANFRRICDIAYDDTDNALYTVENTDAPKGLRRIKGGNVETVIADFSAEGSFNPKAVLFSNDKDTLFVGSDAGEDAVVYMLRSEDFKTPHSYIKYSDGITGLLQYATINPETGSMVLFCQKDRKVFVWRSGKSEAEEIADLTSFYSSNSEGTMRFSPDGGTLYIVPNTYHGILKAEWDLTRNTISGDVQKFVGGNGTGSTDGKGTDAKFNDPFSICFAPDESGNMYVADRGNHRIRLVTPEGEVSTYAGSEKGFSNGDLLPGEFSEGAKFCRPCAVTIGEDNLLYIAEYRDGTADLGNRVRVIRYEEVQ